MILDDSDNLEHFGVKGMQWGVRKKGMSKKAATQDSREKARRLKASNNRRILKDEDLDKYIARLDKEKKLKNLTDNDVKPGSTFAKAVMSQAGRTAATAILTGAAMYGVRAALQGKFSATEAAAYLKPKK